MDWTFPHRSQRMPLLADNVVVTSQPLAARAGLLMLEQGGNAVDAALAAAITLTVVEPVMNGVGSDTQVLLTHGDEVIGLNSSGRSPAAWSAQRFQGRTAMPTEGWDAVTVPGTVSAWVALARQHGSLPLATLMAPAVRYAEQGFMVTPVIARQWASQLNRLKSQPGFAQAFMPEGRAPRAGERFSLPALGKTLIAIAETEGRAFYEGALAEQMVAHARSHGGAMTADDLTGHAVEWVAPMTTRYRSLDVHQMPPNTQGLAVLIALGILERLELGPQVEPALRMHLQIEAMKIGFAEVYGHVADPRSMVLPPSALLEPSSLDRRARSIDATRAQPYTCTPNPSGGTVYVCAADASGMAVSLIQSNFMGFGSGVVVPGTGISLNNRGSGFTLEAGHPNRVAGGKRPFHTILPAMLSRGGTPLCALGVVGANMQPQGHVQLISAMEDLGLNPQAALDMPRWRISDDGRIRLEADVAAQVAQGLMDRGHDVEVRPADDIEFGGAQMAWRHEGGWVAASDPRRDGIAAGF